MKPIIIAPTNSNVSIAIKSLLSIEVSEIILVTCKERQKVTEKISEEIKKKNIPVSIKVVKGNMWEDIFRIVCEIKNSYGEDNVIVNVGSGEGKERCILISAAFVNGLKALDIMPDGTVMMLPIMKFSYYKIITPKKMELLKLLYGSNCCESMEELSNATKMSMPLISYHVNGNLKSKGLIELGLVDTANHNKKISIKLSLLGKLLVQGLIEHDIK